MSERQRRHFLRAKEAKKVLETASQKLSADLGQIFGEKADIECVETDFAEIILVNGKPLLVKEDEAIYPTLVFEQYFALAPKVVVDMGAVPYVCKGANVMRPGIRRFEGTFQQGSLVFVVDEKHGKPLAIGEILYNSEEADKVSQGVVVRNIHFVGDRLWSFVKDFAKKP